MKKPFAVTLLTALGFVTTSPLVDAQEQMPPWMSRGLPGPQHPARSIS